MMGIFSTIFGKKKADSPTNTCSNGDPIELEPAIAALQSDAYLKAYDLALPYVASTNPVVYADANRICALAQSRLENWGAAFNYWLTLFENCEPSALNAMQLASTSVMCNEIERGEAWFMKMRQVAENEENFNQITGLTNFISALQNMHRYKEAIPYLDTLKDIYSQLHITDSTFLAMRGLPFFTDFLRISFDIVHQALDVSSTNEWYRTLTEKVDDEGKASIKQVVGL